MSETNDKQEENTDQKAASKQDKSLEYYKVMLPHMIGLVLMGRTDEPFDPKIMLEVLQEIVASSDINSVQRAIKEVLDKATVIPLRINETPLKPQSLAVTFTVLTELTTKFWLLANRRLADLVEYTQTRDVRFTDEAGTTIAWATYNSPFSFGLQVDEIVPKVAEAAMIVVDRLTQRKAHLKQLELENQAIAQKIKDDEQKSELELTRQELSIEREKVMLLRETMEAQKQGIEFALQIASDLVDKLYPEADAETKGMSIRTLLPNILQLDTVKGLELALPTPKTEEDSPKEDAEQ